MLHMSGSISALNAALDGLQYHAVFGQGTGFLSVLIAGATDGSRSASFGLPITVLGEFDSFPTMTLPGPQSVALGSVLVFSVGGGNPVSVTDGQAYYRPETVLVQVQHGRLRVGDTAALLADGGEVAGIGTSFLSFFAPLGDINRALDGLEYSPDPGATGDFLSVLIDDDGNGNMGGPLRSVSAGLPIAVTP
jgi:hypothetical protein